MLKNYFHTVGLDREMNLKLSLKLGYSVNIPHEGQKMAFKASSCKTKAAVDSCSWIFTQCNMLKVVSAKKK